MKNSTKLLIKNSFMQYLMYAAKMIFPLITLPYMTRVLSVDSYGAYTYVNTCMSYAVILIDFGFMLSATKNIVAAKDDKNKIGEIIGSVIAAKIILAAIAAVAICIMIFCIDLLRNYVLFTFLMFAAVCIDILLPDYLFRALEKMEIITYRFLICKTISTVLLFVLVKNDSDLLFVPVLNIISEIIAVVTTLIYVYKSDIHIHISGFRNSLKTLKEGNVYFISNFATTAFGAFNTLLIGIFFNAEDVAFWGVSMQLINAAQGLYSPIINSAYPRMLKDKNIKLILNILKIFMPLILIACLGCYLLAGEILTLLCGAQYLPAAKTFQLLLPVLIFSFPAMLLGWPTLGAIDKVKQTTTTTIIASIVQVALIGILLLANSFTIINLAIMRGLTELTLLLSRASLCIKYKKELVE